MTKYAIFSVTDKTDIVKLGKKVAETYKIIASGGTAKVLQEGGIEVIEVSNYTESPEMFGGRVKTLHPKIHGAILFKDTPEDRNEAANFNVEEIEIVVCNLYQFEDAVANGASEEKIVEKIDIGGPTLIRSAAKNYSRVLVVTSPLDYDDVIASLPDISFDLRRTFATKAFNLVTQYDIAIADYFNTFTMENQKLPFSYYLAGSQVSKLKYGENAHQESVYYSSSGEPFFENLSDNEVSYNNLIDLTAGWNLANDYPTPTCAIIKHRSPCGLATGEDLTQVYLDALKTDQLSAYGGVYVFNRKIDKKTAEELVKMFVDLLFATDYDPEAIEVLKTKKKMKILKLKDNSSIAHDIHSVPGGFVVQESDFNQISDDQLEFVSDLKPDEDTLKSLKFAFQAVKHSRSNAIVVAKDTRALGIGSGQTSRVDATDSAIKRAGDEVQGSVLASDAFFPFADSIEKAAKVGIRAVISPKGSIRDNEVIEAANKLGVILVFTTVRAFKH